jgi:hypothetical protein
VDYLLDDIDFEELSEYIRHYLSYDSYFNKFRINTDRGPYYDFFVYHDLISNFFKRKVTNDEIIIVFGLMENIGLIKCITNNGDKLYAL